MALTDIHQRGLRGHPQTIGTMKVPVYTLIEAVRHHHRRGVAEIRHRHRAADAKRLRVKPGSAGLVVTRRYFGDNDRPIEVAVNLHPAGRFSYSMSMRLHVPAGADA